MADAAGGGQPAQAAVSAPDAAPARAAGVAAAPAALFTSQQYEDTIRRVPEGPQVVDVRGVAVHVAPNVMFNRIAAKPPWHMDSQRHERKEMISDMCVTLRCLPGSGCGTGPCTAAALRPRRAAADPTTT
jgi:hypothetical protein